LAVKGSADVSKLLEGRTVMTLSLLGLSLYFVIAGFGYGPRSRIFPLVIGIPTAVLTAFVLLAVWKPSVIDWADVYRGASPDGAEAGYPQEQENEPITNAVRMIGWLILAVLAIALFGFRLAVPIYIALFGRLEGRAGWASSILVGVFCWAFIVGYFELFMKFKMFKGVLFGDVLPLF
jgi:hypothetical protein